MSSLAAEQGEAALGAAQEEPLSDLPRHLDCDYPSPSSPGGHQPSRCCLVLRLVPGTSVKLGFGRSLRDTSH